jgi:glycosyltransferase involved in cell wall biosynthesis
MRVTIINQFYAPDISPTAHLAASLAEDRARRGDDVTVVASLGGYVPTSAQAKAEHEGNPTIHRLWTPRFGKATILKRCLDYLCFYVLCAWTLMTMPRQDVIISLTTPPYIAWTAWLHRLFHPSAKIVLWNMDCYPDAAERLGVMNEGGVMSRSMRWLNRRLFSKLDHLVTLDTAMTDLLVSQYVEKPDELPVTVIPNWEKAEMFPAGADPGEWAPAAEYGLADRFTVVYLGNTGYGHEFDTVLDAAKQLEGEPVTFLFVGGGKRWDEISEGARARGLSNVIMHGYVPKEETPAVMGAADCALITLRDISLGVMSPSKMHANLAAGLPILYVGPKRSNVDDGIERFGAGVSLREGDVSGVASFIRESIADQAAHGERRQKARRAFDEAYNDGATLPAFERVLASLASKPAGATREASA